MAQRKLSIPIKLKAGVVVCHKGKVLLIRELNNLTGKYGWNIIKGTFEPAVDRNIEATAIREASEEAKARIRLRHVLGIYYLNDRQSSLTMFAFIGDLLNKGFGTRTQKQQQLFRRGEDIIDVRLFSRIELARLGKKDFVGLRGYLAIRDYLRGVRYPLSLLTTLRRKSLVAQV